MGEPAGVSAEITAAAWHALRHEDERFRGRYATRVQEGCCFFVLDDPARYQRFGIPIRTISAPHEAARAFGEALPVLPLKAPVTDQPGHLSPANANGVIEAIERAVGFALSGEACAIVTNPIQKSVLNMAGFHFPGHTEFLGALCEAVPMPGGRPRGPVMMIAGPSLKTVPVTIHQSVRDAARGLTADQIIAKARVVHDALIHDFAIASPRLAISGLNPHAGEDGRMGTEDRDVIAPAVSALQKTGINAVGPLPADTMFHERARAGYDAAICMLHDQALIPAKTLAFDSAVNVTLGLPIIRTSPDHGTALDIAGKGLARPDSLIAALRLAQTLAAGRRADLAQTP